MSPWISTSHAAALCKKGADWVRARIDDRTLRARRPGRNWQVCRESVMAYLRRIENGARS